MDFLPESVSKLINELAKLPGIGPKSAQRLGFHLLKHSETKNKILGNAILNVKEGVTLCSSCFTLTSGNLCRVCSNLSRDHSTLCVVETTMDMIAIEKTGQFRGLYHVLHGKISPLDGIGPDDLKMKELFVRLKSGEVMELILATNPDLEGETTALYLQKQMADFPGLKVSRIARGIPSGGIVEYTDEATLIKAIEGRQLLK